MINQENILKSLGDSIKSIGEYKLNLMQKLTVEERLKINQFEIDYATLMASGDFIGAKNLADKFNEKPND